MIHQANSKNDKKKGGFFKTFFNNVTPYLDTEKRCIETGHIKNEMDTINEKQNWQENSPRSFSFFLRSPLKKDMLADGRLENPIPFTENRTVRFP